MRNYIIIGILLLTLVSCYKPGEISIENNVSNATLNDIYWGDIYLTSDLLPGESSNPKVINKTTEKLPASYRVSFVLEANNKKVYLETDEEFLLDEDDQILIVIDDETLVVNK
ncbi:MAG TPA: hypothetical protein DDX39_04130 [Bacteroidales bacterium]|nr:MAG: hypothetical protein A2W98_09290 [Bacteroidetes bacterium GWF2_33_38]OFY75291.1 MAG: hypothetical protein A2265_10135 [Bacteroidetes bacterium RIFOXYA12_FULL_33_9]OFY88957.1 MAG: hypothetical protein A2236_06405 [Bacteroidetes bacterium RIFOXYA2_FULL_33_7]HBF87810.1 hypothetical protein [Bacteroidales bacterium]